MAETPRAAVYLRVSTECQTTANQLEEVMRLAGARGFEPVVYDEIVVYEPSRAR